MDYSEALDYMLKQLPMFHRIGAAAYKANLNNAIALDNYFNTPHKSYKTIHVAGTNGKGSVSHMLASVLQKAGYKTGLFTSPHLKDFRERIRINGEMLTENYVAEFISNHQHIFSEIQPSFFEMTSALAFQYFSDEKVDIAVIEVGMGGRLDSTNIITPILSVITNIGLDHTQFLGDTLAKIAAEKAGIIKPQIPVVIGEYNIETFPVFNQYATKNNSPLYLAEDEFSVGYSLFTPERKQVFQVSHKNKIAYPNLTIDLAGFYQKKNICSVLTAVQTLNENGILINEKSVYAGLENTASITGLKGRWQTIGTNPLIICDTGHNIDGMQYVTEQIKQTPHKQLHMVIGFVEDKSLEPILKILPQNTRYYFTQAKIERALPAMVLAEKAAKFGLNGQIIPDVALALKTAKEAATENDMIFIGGSTFVVAEIL